MPKAPKKKPAPAPKEKPKPKAKIVKQPSTLAGAVVASLQKAHGTESAMLLGSSPRSVLVCPTGLEVVDRWVLGVGGMPYGRVVEVFGPPSSTKTTIINKLMAGCQRMGGVAALAETEQCYDLEWAKLHGVDVANLVFLQPNYLDGEGGFFEELATMCGSSSKEHPVVVVLDSVAASSTKAEFDAGINGEAAVAEAARVWSAGLRKLNSILSRSHAMLVLVNQTRSKVGVMFGNPEQSTGGVAIKFYSSIRLSCFPGKKDPSGLFQMFHLRADKNKLCPPFRKAVVKLDFREGYDERWNTINYAKDVGCLPKATHISNKAWLEACESLGWPKPDSVKITDEVITQGEETTDEPDPGEAT